MTRARDRSLEPRFPSRLRVIRPQLYSSEVTGALPPDCRDLLVGLSTLTDDTGYTMWQPRTLAAAIYPYESAGRRVKDLERRAAILQDADLLRVEPCGCAFLPTLVRDLRPTNGNYTHTVAEFHAAQHVSVSVLTSTGRTPSDSVPVTVPVPVSDSEKVPVSVARPTLTPRGAKPNGQRNTSSKTGDPWQGYDERWLRFKLGWLGIGLTLPPTPEQRTQLWPIVDGWPNEIGRWLGELPPGTGSFEATAHVFKRHADVTATRRDKANAEEEAATPARGGMQPLTAIMAAAATNGASK